MQFTFASLGGLERQKEHLLEMVTNYSLFHSQMRRLEVSAPRAVLFSGAPGMYCASPWGNIFSWLQL